MADFLTAFELTSKWEGGYSNNSLDAGKETYAGISRVNHGNWAGWFIVDKNKPLKQGQVIKDDRLSGMIQAFYLDQYWYKIKGDKLSNQSIANMLYDWTINSGYHAVKAIQKIIGSVPDGVVGPITTLLINKGDQEDIFNRLKDARIKFYQDIVTRNESQRVFLNGWLNRANAFTFQ